MAQGWGQVQQFSEIASQVAQFQGRPSIVSERGVLIDRNLCGDDALDLDLMFQVARLGKIKGQLHAKPCFGCRAECF